MPLIITIHPILENTLPNLNYKDLQTIKQLIPDTISSQFYSDLIDFILYSPMVEYLEHCTTITKMKASKGLNFFNVTPPECIVNFQHITSLGLSSLSILEIPEYITELTNLVKLKVTNCPVKTLPARIGNLINLQQLAVGLCDHFTHFPSSIKKLNRLQKIMIRQCYNFKFDYTKIIALRGLEKLVVMGGVRYYKQLVRLENALKLRDVTFKRVYT